MSGEEKNKEKTRICAVRGGAESRKMGEMEDGGMERNNTYMDRAEARRYIFVRYGERPSVATIWRWCQVGVGPVNRKLNYKSVGRNIRIAADSLEAFFDAVAADRQAALEARREKAALELEQRAVMAARVPRKKRESQVARAKAQTAETLAAHGVEVG